MRALILAAIISVSCAHSVQTLMPGNLSAGGLKRLYCIDHPACNTYRSEQPTAADFDALTTTYHVRSVIKLNSALEGRDHVPAGVEMIEHPWLGSGPVDHEDIAAALWDLEQAPKPVLIHCELGQDRTGLLVALYRVKVQHVLASSSWAEWHAFGHGDGLPMLDEAFFRETGWRP